MQTVNLKPANIEKIRAFAASAQSIAMTGLSAQALYKLIQKKGDPITSDDKHVHGLMALPIAEGEWIAIKRIAVNKNFYPCVLHTYLLTQR